MQVPDIDTATATDTDDRQTARREEGISSHTHKNDWIYTIEDYMNDE